MFSKIIASVKNRFNNFVSHFIPNDNKYAYKNIEEYEEIVGFKVNETFKIAWDMARTKNKHLRRLGRG